MNIISKLNNSSLRYEEESPQIDAPIPGKDGLAPGLPPIQPPEPWQIINEKHTPPIEPPALD